MRITRSELINKLKSQKGARPIGITAETDARLPKKSGYHGTRKISKVNGFIGVDYEKSANRKLDKEGYEPDFKKGDRVWGEHDNGLIRKGDKYYVQVKVERAIQTEYQRNGTPVSVEEIQQFLRKRNEVIKWREYSLDSIKEIRINGEEYEVCGD